MADYSKEELDAVMRRYTEELMRLHGRQDMPRKKEPKPILSPPEPLMRSAPPRPEEPPRPMPMPPRPDTVFPAPLPEFPQENRPPEGWNGNSLPPDVILRAENAMPMPIADNPLIKNPAEPPEMGGGSLVVTVRTAESALPVAGAAVTVTDERYGDPRLMAVLVTNRDGITPRITLPAPHSAPDAQNVKFAVYTVQVEADGYLPERIVDVAVLDGQSGTLPVSLKPAPVNLVVPEQVEYSSMPEF